MILFIEDDPNIRELVVYTLEKTGKRAYGFNNAKTFYTALETRSFAEKPELVLLDIMLPGEDGLGILKKIRGGKFFLAGLGARTPVIMLTAKNAEYDKVRFLDAGADDYIVKPFGMMELIARVHAVLRRSNSDNQEAGSDTLVLGNMAINMGARRLLVAGKRVELTAKEFELLSFLLHNRDTVMSRERLLDKVWGYEFTAETRTVDVHIRTLRQKLASSGVSADYIETVRGVGYRISDGTAAPEPQ
ncbi:MAG: response regulator transcription factor [Spirochaetaceae bacterium]|jgi:two-component system alkaline phosphatase synthesis response regulator PhoP|nr:response regulator transcription factor [Spirochaetaceae bacterium]